jgi:hypothetical protein
MLNHNSNLLKLLKSNLNALFAAPKPFWYSKEQKNIIGKNTINVMKGQISFGINTIFPSLY